MAAKEEKFAEEDDEDEDDEDYVPSATDKAEDDKDQLSGGDEDDNKNSSEATKDTKTRKRRAPQGTPRKNKKRTEPSTSATVAAAAEVKDTVVTVTKTYKFAGEDVTIQEKVTAKEAAKIQSSKTGLDGLLSKFGKKDKLSTLSKSKHDWNQYVTSQNLVDELKQNNKDGYLERQEFLRRTEERQYEIERARRFGQPP